MKIVDEKIKVKNLNFYYIKKKSKSKDHHVLKGITIPIYKNKITSLIGPSGCGKSTFLKTLNRLVDLYANVRIEGEILLDEKDIFSIDVVTLRRRVGMVFQSPNPFPKSVFDNIAYGPRLFGIKESSQLEEIVKRRLKEVDLWEALKDRLNDSALELSGGQQQRLCIARALAVEPELLLMDEPASSLDPISTTKVEELIFELKKKYTILIVTHNMHQAARISDFTAFLYYGELVEFGSTEKIFTNPNNKKTEDYVTGRFG